MKVHDEVGDGKKRPRPMRSSPTHGSGRLRPTLRRLLRNVALGVGCATSIPGIVWLLDSPRPFYEMSLATAYVGLALLSITLLLGPWNVLGGHPNPVSTHLRRDIGIWAALVAGLHVAVGFQSHFTGDLMRWFRHPDGHGMLGGLRYDPFGLASWTGLGATVLLLILLALSNDLALRRLGTGRWKGWQRANYAVFGAVIVHGVIFQVLEKRLWPWMGLVGAAAVVVVAFQALGFRRMREAQRGALESTRPV